MTGIYEDQYVDLSDGATLVQALRGDFGPELQAEAATLAGLELEDDYGQYDPEQEEMRAAGQELASQVHTLEMELGRPLSKREVDTIIEDHSLSENIDVKGSYERRIGRDMRKPEDRQAYGTEIYEQHREDAEYEREAEEARFEEGDDYEEPEYEYEGGGGWPGAEGG
jgi:hypothetical protein